MNKISVIEYATIANHTYHPRKINTAGISFLKMRRDASLPLENGWGFYEDIDSQMQPINSCFAQLFIKFANGRPVAAVMGIRDYCLDLHWVYIKSNDFIMARPRHGKTGGVILSRSMEKDKLIKILTEDPFVSENLAEMQIVHFDAPLTSDAFKALQNL